MRSVRFIILLLFLMFVFSSLVRNILNYKDKLSFYQQFKKDYEDEKKRNLTLKTGILKQSDPYEIESTIRNKLNLLKEDEMDFILPQPTPTKIIITPTQKPNWEQWKDLLLTN